MKHLERALACSAALALMTAACDGMPTDAGAFDAPEAAAVAPTGIEVHASPPKGTPSPVLERESVVRKIELMQETIPMIQTRLEPCDTNVCDAVREHAGVRYNEAGLAKTAAEDREWQTATFHLTEVRDLVEDDIALLESVEDRGSIGDVLGLERALLNQTDAALDAVERQG